MPDVLNILDRHSRVNDPARDRFDAPPAPRRCTFAEYLAMDRAGRLVEYVDGWVEVLPIPMFSHQTLVGLLWLMLRTHRVAGEAGLAGMAPFDLYTISERYRQPDVVFLLPRNRSRFDERSWTYADLVIEVVSPDDPSRDYVVKRVEYAQAGIPEYWIVDPRSREIIVLKLEGSVYVQHQHAREGDVAMSALLEGFAVDVKKLFDDATP
jgi:Uma2 family endonuclease